MRLSFLGGAREVGRSCILVAGQRNTLLDCGIKFDEKREEYPLLDEATVRSLDRAVISHAHLDHSAYAPALFRMGFSKKVFLTKPTRDLMQLLLADYLKLAKERGTAAYAEAHVNKLLQSTLMPGFGDDAAFEKHGVRFQHSGHILGSALVELQDEKKVLYTGDLNLRETRLLEPAKKGLSAQVLVIESTYGSRKDKHPSVKAASQIFSDLVKNTLEKGGKVLIPSFAVGRGQEVLFTLESYFRSRSLPIVPIYLDGMIKKALKIYRHNAADLKREIQLRILSSDSDPFKSEHYFVPSRKDRSDVFEGGSCIVLATSGMLTGGPIISYLRALGTDSKNSLIMVGYQSQGTPGRALLEGAKEITVGDEVIPVELPVFQAPFSAHADHDSLVEFAKGIHGLEKVFVVHGEGTKSDELAEDIERQCNRGEHGQHGAHSKKVEAVVPELGETYDA